LDIDSREALESALEQFDGTIVTVSHDRYLIDKLATRILAMKPGAAFEGDLLDYEVSPAYEGQGYTEFLRYKTAREAERASEGATVATAASAPSAGKADYLKNKQSAAEERKKRNRLQKLRELMPRLEDELVAIEEQMSGEAATDYKKLAELDEKKNALEEQLMSYYEESEQLERELEGN
jgi:ATP-binding cassette subfamily F protein 3